ncbi:hypothetical protein FKM82_016113 [Ascaphus truei]
MEAMLENLDHFVEVLALSRSIHVKDWDILSVQRAFQWGTYFQHVHHRFEVNDPLRCALEDRVRLRSEQLCSCIKNYQFITFKDLGQSAEILCMSLLQNKALPKDVYQYLVAQFRDGDSTSHKLHCLNHIISQKAGCQMLLSLPSIVSNGHQNPLDNPIVITQADLLRSSLEYRIKTLEEDKQLAVVSEVLYGITQPQVFHLLAVMLTFDDGSNLENLDSLSHLLLEWLLENDCIWSGFCSNLNCQVISSLSSRYPKVKRAYLDLLAKLGGSMEQDITCGKWISSSPELSFKMLLDNFRCMMKGNEHLKSATETTLKTLKAQDGNFDVPGVSIWTDLLLEIEKR